MWFTLAIGSNYGVGKVNPENSVALAKLSGSVVDDGLPTGAALTGTWNQVSGPGPVAFSNQTSTFADLANQIDPVSTEATFTTPGVYVLSLTGSDSQLSASANVTITVNTSLVFAPQTLPAAVTGAAYSASIVASGGTLPYNFAVTSGSLPPGITLGTNGAFNGTATTVGSFTFSVTVTDSSATPQTATQTFTLQVTNPLAIVTTTLPGGTASTPYSANISTTGGVLPVGFAVTAGALPPGLGLSLAAAPPQTATVSGTPTLAGTFTFTITATDSFAPAATASQSYTVTIAPAVVPPANVIFVTPMQNSIQGQVLAGSPVQVVVTDNASNPLPNASSLDQLQRHATLRRCNSWRHSHADH